jgi:hypothetical protein
VALALVPWAAFLLVLVIAGPAEGEPIRPDGVARASAGYLLFVALPCLFPLAVARPGWQRGAVITAMTVVAVLAAVAMVTSDDAQAGLAVLIVPYVARPLGAVPLVGRAIASRLHR